MKLTISNMFLPIIILNLSRIFLPIVVMLKIILLEIDVSEVYLQGFFVYWHDI